ncbi:hypothetical protein D3C83_213690 [compost metagenome]
MAAPEQIEPAAEQPLAVDGDVGATVDPRIVGLHVARRSDRSGDLGGRDLLRCTGQRGEQQ